MTERYQKLGLTMFALLPCVAAIAAGSAGVATSPLPIRHSDSPLIFRQYGVSLGEVGPYPAVEAYYTFRNDGDQPVTITEMVPSCGCVRCSLHGNQKTFQPGEFGRLTVNMQTANGQPGPHHYTIRVAAEDGAKTHTETLSFRVTLPDRKVAVEPSEIFFYQLHGQPEERVIHVADYRGLDRSLSVTAAVCHSPQVDVEVLPPVTGENGQVRTPIRLKVPAQVPEGREITHVWIATSDPDYPRIAVPVLIQGREANMTPNVPRTAEAPHGLRNSSNEVMRSVIQQVSGSTLSDDTPQ